MRSENKISETIRLLKRHYWGNILFLALFFLLIVLGVISLFGDEQQVSVTLERYAIMVPIIAIPLLLKHFAHRIKKVARPVEIATAIEIYKKASYLRLYTLSAITLGQIILFGYSQNMNFFWFTVVLFVVFLFCSPSYEELKAMVEKEMNGEEQLEEKIEEETVFNVENDEKATGE